MKKLLRLFFLIPCCVATTIQPAFFLEEAKDQTIVSAADRRTAEGLEDQILDILDLDEAPSRFSRTKRDGKVASFMAKLYSQLENESHAHVDNSLQQWISADKILSVAPSEVVSISSSGLYKLTIPVTDMVTDSSPSKSVSVLTIAQLHVYLAPHSDVISVIVQIDRDGSLRDLASVNLPADSNTLAVNVTQEVDRWLMAEGDPHIFVRLQNEYGSAIPDLVDSFIVAAFEEGHRPIRRRSRRASSDAPIEPPRNPHQTKRVDPFNGETPNPLDGCRKQGLYVSFQDLGWKEWVIAPEGYMAFYCGGACSFPLHNRMNATNHAIVQTLAHLVHPSRAEEAKCAPSQLAPMKILFIDNHQNVVMKRYRDMIVQECGCH